MVEYTLTEGEKLTDEQLEEVKEAKKNPIVYDEDAPKLSSALKKALECAAGNKRRFHA